MIVANVVLSALESCLLPNCTSTLSNGDGSKYHLSVEQDTEHVGKTGKTWDLNQS